MQYDPKNVIVLPADEALSVYGVNESGSIGKVLTRLQSGVDAWVCASMGIGWSLTRSFLERGIRIPEDVAVTGYHRNMEDPPDLPLLTTTDIMDEELGAAALRQLLHRFEFPRDATRMLLLSAPLLARGTTRNHQAGG
jgi:LacI family transcriptional regulator